ncbi:hypothetical protein THAOC_05369, partial [Thalassiosira oceanica]
MDERTAKRQKKHGAKSPGSSHSSGDSSCDYLWPTETEDASALKLPSNSLLSSLDDLLWGAMARVPPLDDVTEKPKNMQVFVREALKLIGLDFVATDGAYLRIKIASKRKKAMELFEKHKYNLPKSLPEIRSVKIIDSGIPRHLIYSGCFMDVLSTHREEIWASLVSHGVVLIKNALSGIPHNACGLPANSKRKKITYTSGNGVDGVAGSYYADSPSEYWVQVQNKILRALLTDDDCYRRVKSRKKAIILSYSQGSENWAHKDGNDDANFPFQATVLLTDDKEFDGGEFYVAKKLGIDEIARTIVKMRESGDMVLFAASKKLPHFHGMLT